MEASMKYSLNPLAACFVPLSMKARTGNVNGDSNSIQKEKCVPVYSLEYEPTANKTKTDYSEVRNLDLMCKQMTVEDFCISKNSVANESVYKKATPGKIVCDETSIDRSEDGTSIEEVDFMEQKDTNGNCSMELERTSDMADIADPFETERTLNMNEITNSIKMNSIPNISLEDEDSDILKENLSSILVQGKIVDDYDSMETEQYSSISSTESLDSAKSYRSDYGTDVDCKDLSTEMLSNIKSGVTTENGSESIAQLASSRSDGKLNLQVKSKKSSLYTTVLLSSILSSIKGEAKTCSKVNLEAGSRLKEECFCPPMFGWIIPFDYFGNPLNLSADCKKNYVHTTYEHAIYDKTFKPNTCHDSLDFEDYSIDSGNCSDEDEPSSSVEDDTMEQYSSELESIIKDVFDCVDQSLSSCEDVKPDATDKNSDVWLTANEIKVIKDSPVIDDGYHPLLQDTTSEDVDKEILNIEKFLGEAFTFGNKDVDEFSSQSSCIPPCSVWCTNVPPPVIDTFKRFVKDSEPSKCKAVDKDKVLRKHIYKRCFSANDAPKDSDHAAVLRLASCCKPKTPANQKDLDAFQDSNGLLNSNNMNVSNFVTGQRTNPLKEGSDTWSLYDGADSMWQPLPDCVLSTDQSHKYAYKRARIMKRQKSVG